jgi:hypothetical protein
MTSFKNPQQRLKIAARKWRGTCTVKNYLYFQKGGIHYFRMALPKGETDPGFVSAI